MPQIYRLTPVILGLALWGLCSRLFCVALPALFERVLMCVQLHGPGRRGRGHCNLMLSVLMQFSAMADMAVMYIRTIGEHAPATVFGPSRDGDRYVHLTYPQIGKEIDEHDADAPFDRMRFPIRSPFLNPQTYPRGRHVQLLKMRARLEGGASIPQQTQEEPPPKGNTCEMY